MKQKNSNLRKISVVILALALSLSFVFSAYADTAKVAGTVRLEDDYFDYVNGEFSKDKVINPETGDWSVTSELAEDTDKRTDEIIKNLGDNIDKYNKDSVERKVAQFYLSAKDTESREKADLKCLKPVLDLVENAKDIKELGNVWAKISIYAYSLPMLPSFDIDPYDADHFVYYVYGDTTDFDFTDFDKKTIKEAKKYISKMLVGYGLKEEEGKAYAKGIAKYFKDMSKAANEGSDDEEEYYFYNMSKLKKLYSNLDMEEIMKINEDNLKESIKVNKKEILVGDPNFAKVLNKKYLRNDKLDLMKKLTIFMLLDSFAGQYQCLPERFQKANLELTNFMYGVEEKYDPEKQALESTRFTLEEEVGKLYTDKYFTPKMKEDAKKLVTEVWEAYKTKVKSTKWMSEKTKAGALKKLENLTMNVGYPNGEWGKDVLTCQLASPKEGGDLLTNVLEYMKNSGKTGEPSEFVNKEAWPLGVTEVNAMYDATKNSITIPAGILQPPFYTPDGDYASNLGGTGVTIGHEITHAFDNDGANYDERGNYRNWWTKKDYRQFKKLQKIMIKHFGALKINDLYIDGKLTLPENIADLGGMEVVVQLVPKDKESLRKFFESYARSWASKYTDTYIENLISDDEHAPDKIRVNAILGLTDEFYEAYDLKKGDKMYVPPKKRINIW